MERILKQRADLLLLEGFMAKPGLGAQFTCFTGTKVQILAGVLRSLPEQAASQRLGTQFTCFTGTNVQILTQKALLDLLRNAGVTVVMNVKHKVLATISAATGATIAQVA